MPNRALRNIFLFCYRIPIFIDFVIHQLSQAQADLAFAAKAIDVSSTEKRNLRALLDVVEEINKAVSEAIRIKTVFLQCFSPDLRRLIREQAPALIQELGPSDWSMAVGSFTFFLQDLNRFDEIEGSFSFVNLLALGQNASFLDLFALQILQIVIAVNLAADGIASMSKAFGVVLTLSVEGEDAAGGLVHDIRGLAGEISCQLQQLKEALGQIGLHFEKSGNLNQSPPSP